MIFVNKKKCVMKQKKKKRIRIKRNKKNIMIDRILYNRIKEVYIIQIWKKE